MLTVTPLVGVWIEIIKDGTIDPAEIVTPLVGVWIEISIETILSETEHSHSPCGSVD